MAHENRNRPTEAPPGAAEQAGRIDIDFSPGLADFLAASDISIGFTSHQTGRLYLVGRGIQILSAASGAVAHWLRFDGAITELFDICVLPGVRNPITLGPQSAEIRDFVTIESPG